MAKRAQRGSNSTAITSASDVGRPYREPKSYRPASPTQRRIIGTAVAALIPGGALVRGARGAGALLGRGRSATTSRGTTAAKKDDWSSEVSRAYSARNIRAQSSYKSTKAQQAKIEAPKRAAQAKRDEQRAKTYASISRSKSAGKTGGGKPTGGVNTGRYYGPSATPARGGRPKSGDPMRKGKKK